MNKREKRLFQGHKVNALNTKCAL